MNNNNSITRVLVELIKKSPSYFLRLVLVVMVESVVLAAAVVSIIPLADYMLDQSLSNSSEFTQMIVDLLLYFGLTPGYWPFGLLFVSLSMFGAITRMLSTYFILKIKYSIIKKMLNGILSNFLNSRWSFFSDSNQGVLMNTLNKELAIVSDTFGHLAMQFARIFQIFIYLFVPFYINFEITITMVMLTAFFAIPFLLLSRYSYALGKISTDLANKMAGIFAETLQAAKIIIGYARQDKSRERYILAYSKYMDSTIKSQTLQSGTSILFLPLGMLSVILAIGIFMQGNGDLQLSELTAIMYSLLSSAPLIAAFLQTNVSIVNFVPSYEQVTSLQEKSLKLAEIRGSIIFSRLKQGIAIKNLDFSYNTDTSTLVNLNMEIKKGKMTSIVGESGSGKSTIVDLIMGLQIPSNGIVEVDNISLSDLDQNSFREKIGYVPQDSILFNTSIKNNLLWSNSLASEEDIMNSLRLSNSDSFVNHLPDGIDTIVGDRGVRLSGGQRQRIALARALVRNPELIILDEATSSLDTESELMIQKSIEELSGRMTVLIVAHRLSTIKKSDMVYVLKSGSVVEHGSFKKLSLREDSALNKMLIMQNYTS
jgi:ABC-type multidrug transport system fused ATPase/permease subunit